MLRLHPLCRFRLVRAVSNANTGQVTLNAAIYSENHSNSLKDQLPVLGLRPTNYTLIITVLRIQGPK